MTIDIAPSDLGLPPKFTAYRRGQAEIALDIASSDTRYDALDSPTGTGKSLIAISVARLLNARTLVLVGTKGLQTQYMADFERAGMVDVRGANNYRCLALRSRPRGILYGQGEPDAMCDEGPCKAGIGCYMKKHGGCLYYDAVGLAAHADIVVTNYSMWLTLGMQADPLMLGKFDLLICDEAHTAPNWLTEHCAVELDRNEVRALLSVELPPIDEGVDVWAAWARAQHAEASRRRNAYYDVSLDGKETLRFEYRNAHTLRLIFRLQRLIRALSNMSRAQAWKNANASVRDVQMPGMESDWIAQPTPKGQKFSPVWAHAYAEEALFRGIPKIVLCSATLSHEVPKYLGVDAEQLTWHEVRSGFAKRRRPFYICTATRVDHRMSEGQKMLWMNRIDAIIEKRLDRKGIIHSVSYARAEEIKRRSRFGDCMLIHTTQTARETIARFKSSDAPCILVSPSVTEGYDFPHDQARWQIVVKIPFPDGRDLLFKARKKADPNYGNYLASLALMQMTGRSTRAHDDASEVFVIDEHWWWFANKIRWPRWFKESWVKTRVVPEALDIEALAAV